MRQQNVLIIGSLAALGLVIVLGVILFRAAPSPAAASPSQVLWTLIYLQVNDQAYELAPEPVTLTLQETSHTMTGSTGCNSYQAIYQQHHAQIHIQAVESTLVLCSDPVGEQETRYLQALARAETLLVSAHTMTITGARGKDLLRFSSLYHERVDGEPFSSSAAFAQAVQASCGAWRQDPVCLGAGDM